MPADPGISILDPQPPPPPNPWPLRLGVGAVVLVLVGTFAWSEFRYYGERRQVERFMDALVAGDYQTAYQLWKPSPAYPYQSFLEDWGETNSHGRIRNYEIVRIAPPQNEVGVRGGGTLSLGGESTGLIAYVRINGMQEPVRIWVERKDKSLSFPPF